MALNNSGPLSFGGSTTGQSINLELGFSATATASIDSAAFRNLAGVASGQISVSNFYGKSNAAYGFVGVVGNFGTSNNLLELGGTGQDSSGNFYVASTTYTGNVSGQKYGAYLAKFNSVGALQWQRKAIVAGTTNSQLAKVKIYIDSSSNVYVAWGNGNGGIGQTLIKYNSSGVIVYQKQFNYGGGYFQVVGDMAVDSSENLYIAGYSYGGYGGNGSLLKYSISGTLLATARYIFAGSPNAMGIGIDSSNRVYVCGAFGNDPNYQSTIVQLNSSLVSIRQNFTGSGFITGANINSGLGVAVAPSGDNYLSCFQLSSNLSIVSKYDSAGALQWARSFNTGRTFRPPMIRLDSDGNLYAVAEASGISGIFSQLIIKFNSSGTVQWQRNLAWSGNRLFARGFTVTPTGGIIIGGCFGFDSNNGYVTKLPVDGSKTGTYTVSGLSMEYTVSSVTISTFSHSNTQQTSTTLASAITGYNENIGLTWTESADTSTTTFTTI